MIERPTVGEQPWQLSVCLVCLRLLKREAEEIGIRKLFGFRIPPVPGGLLPCWWCGAGAEIALIPSRPPPADGGASSRRGRWRRSR